MPSGIPRAKASVISSTASGKYSSRNRDSARVVYRLPSGGAQRRNRRTSGLYLISSTYRGNIYYIVVEVGAPWGASKKSRSLRGNVYYIVVEVSAACQA